MKTEDDGTGNYGLEDLRTSYKWVAENIGDFGGDATQITVFGMSSGAYNSLLVALDTTLLPAPQRVIAMSPPTSLKPKNATFALWYGRKIMHALKCQTTECLRSVRPARIYYSVTQYRDGWFAYLMGSALRWMPAYDDSLVTNRPMELIKNATPALTKRLAGIDLMIGTAHDEAALFMILSEFGGRGHGSTFFLIKGSWPTVDYFRSLLFGQSRNTEADRVAREALNMEINHEGRVYVQALLNVFKNE